MYIFEDHANQVEVKLPNKKRDRKKDRASV